MAKLLLMNLQIYLLQEKVLQQQFDSTVKKVTVHDSGITTSTATEVSKTLSLPKLELFASVSNICIFLSHKECKQPIMTSIYPLVMVDLKQPTLAFSNIKESKLEFKLLGLDILSSSFSDGFSRDSHIPSKHDFDITFLTCGNGSSVNPLPTFFALSLILKENFECMLNISLDKTLYLTYKLLPSNNIELFYKKVQQLLLPESTNSKPENTVEVIEKKEIMEPKSYFPVKISNIQFSTKRLHFLLSLSKREHAGEINIQYDSFTSNTSCRYENDINIPQNITCSNSIEVLEIYLAEEKRLNLVTPMNMKMDLSGDFYEGCRY